MRWSSISQEEIKLPSKSSAPTRANFHPTLGRRSYEQVHSILDGLAAFRACSTKEGTMEEAVRLNAAEPASTEADTGSLPRCEHALELLLTHRGNPSAEVDRVLADDPQCVFGSLSARRAHRVRRRRRRAIRHWPRAWPPSRRRARTCDDPARRHAAAARAWLEGDPPLQPSVTAPSSSTGRATFSRSWSHMRSTSASAGGACCGIVSPRCCRNGRPRQSRLRERPGDVRVRPRGERPVPSCRKDGAPRARPRPTTSGRHSRRRPCDGDAGARP